MAWKFKSCKKCRGYLMLEDAEWRCVQCGRYYFLRNAELYDPSWEVRSRSMEQASLPADGRIEVAALAG